MGPRIYGFLLVCMIFLNPFIAFSEWVQVGGSLNVDVNQDVEDMDIEIINSQPYVIWTEASTTSSQAYVKHYNGTNWNQIGGSLNRINQINAKLPRITHSGSTPYVSWAETTGQPGETYLVRRYDGSNWVLYGTDKYLYQAFTLDCIYFDEALYRSITASTTPPNIIAERWNGSDWEVINSGLDIPFGTMLDKPHFAENGNVLYYSYLKFSPNYKILVYKTQSTTWEQISSNLNINSSAYAGRPHMAAGLEGVFVTWAESGKIYLKYYNGTSWYLLGDGLNFDGNRTASNPVVGITGKNILVAWQESNGVATQICVKRFDGNQWILEGSINVDLARNATNPKLAVSETDGQVYITWQESNGIASQVYVKKRVTDKYIDSLLPLYSLPGIGTTLYVQNHFLGSDLTLNLGNGQNEATAANVTTETPYRASGTFNLQIPPGCYDLQVEADGNTLTLPKSFFVLEEVPGPIGWQVNDLGQAGAPIEAGQPAGLVVADGDNDGLQEVFATDQEQSIYKYQKSATWEVAPISTPQPEYYGHLAIYDGDYNVTKQVYVASTTNKLYQFSGSEWDKMDLGATLTAVRDMVTGDGDNDGKSELYIASADHKIWKIHNYSDGWAQIEVGEGGDEMISVAVGDGDGDRDFEVYAANKDLHVYQYKYSGVFWQKTDLGQIMAGEMNDLALGDGDNDGYSEVYAACADGKVYQFKWNGSAWTNNALASATGALSGLKISDGDNDGKNEVYACSADGHVYQYEFNSAWIRNDLGHAGTALYNLDIGDGDNDNQFEVYTIGEDHHVYQFKAYSLGTPTATPTATPYIPAKQLKAYPSRINPAQDESMSIRWSQPVSGPVTIKLYNLKGELVTTLVNNQTHSTGQENEVLWKGINSVGNRVASGIYIVRIKSKDYEAYIKVAVIQ